VPVIDQRTREGSPTKRAAILDAAQELFLTDGYDRTSMDAIAAAAKVSKRTVYDYFGGKRGLLLGVVDTGGETLMSTVTQALDTHLGESLGIDSVERLEEALQGFAAELGSTLVTSSAYTLLIRLVSANYDALEPDLREHPITHVPEEALAERLERFTWQGLLDIDDARLAADHFNALTMLLAYAGAPSPARVDPQQARVSIAKGVHAFMRAYAVRA